MEEELIIRAMNKDKESFTKAMLNIEKDLYIIAKSRLHNDDDICDAIQETMLACFQNIHKLKKVKYFKTWVIRILINNCNCLYRKKSKFISIDDENIYNYINSKDLQDEKLNFEFLIRDLKSEEKLLLTMYYYLRYTSKEIAQILSHNENTVKSKILRATNKLKNKFKGDDFYE